MSRGKISFGKVYKRDVITLTFYTNYLALCRDQNVSPSAAAEAMGFRRSVVTKWANGATPHKSTLYRIAEHFGVTVDFLLTGEKEKPAADSDGLKGKLLNLSPEMLNLFVQFLELAEGNPSLSEQG